MPKIEEKNKHHPFHHHFKRVIHPNRHFIWSVVLVFIIGFGLTSFIIITNIDQEADPSFTLQESKKVYVNASQGYRARYPIGWTIETDNSGNVIFGNPALANETITVTPLQNATDIQKFRKQLGGATEENYTRNGLDIMLFHMAPQAANSARTITAIVKSQSKIFVLFGPESDMQAFINNFRIE